MPSSIETGTIARYPPIVHDQPRQATRWRA